jgi:hypothetical protein
VIARLPFTPLGDRQSRWVFLLFDQASDLHPYGLGVRIAAIESLVVLSGAEAELLRGLLEWEDPDVPDIDPRTLAIYVVTTPERGY